MAWGGEANGVAGEVAGGTTGGAADGAAAGDPVDDAAVGSQDARCRVGWGFMEEMKV